MNIGDVTNSGYSSAKHIKPHRVDSPADQESRVSSTADKSDDNQDVRDSIDISKEARQAHAAERKRLQEFEQARELLDSVPEMSAARRHELLERLNSGYYTRADILDQISSRISEDLRQ